MSSFDETSQIKALIAAQLNETQNNESNNFVLNVQVSKGNVKTIQNKDINKNMEIKRLKRLIRYEFYDSIDENSQFDLIYNSVLMIDYNTLNDYNIKDNKHLIQLVFKVQNPAKQKQYTYNISNKINDRIQNDLITVAIHNYENELNNIEMYRKQINTLETKYINNLNHKYGVLIDSIQNRKEAIIVEIKENILEQQHELHRIETDIKGELSELNIINDERLNIFKKVEANVNQNYDYNNEITSKINNSISKLKNSKNIMAGILKQYKIEFDEEKFFVFTNGIPINIQQSASFGKYSFKWNKLDYGKYNISSMKLVFKKLRKSQSHNKTSIDKSEANADIKKDDTKNDDTKDDNKDNDTTSDINSNTNIPNGNDDSPNNNNNNDTKKNNDSETDNDDKIWKLDIPKHQSMVQISEYEMIQQFGDGTTIICYMELILSNECIIRSPTVKLSKPKYQQKAAKQVKTTTKNIPLNIGTNSVHKYFKMECERRANAKMNVFEWDRLNDRILKYIESIQLIIVDRDNSNNIHVIDVKKNQNKVPVFDSVIKRELGNNVNRCDVFLRVNEVSKKHLTIWV